MSSHSTQKQIDAIDQRLPSIDQRLPSIDQRLPSINQRLSAIEDKIDKMRSANIFGSYISQSYSSMPEVPQFSAVRFTGEDLSNLRERFYLRAIETKNPKWHILQHFQMVIDALILSKEFTKYDPMVDGSLYVYTDKTNRLKAEITSPIVTYGSLSWNDIVIGSVERGISRNNGILVFVKNKSDELIMIVIDAWSINGSGIGTSDIVNEKSKGDNRKILFANLTESTTCLHLTSGRYIFSRVPVCMICCEVKRSIRFSCGHGIVCNDCLAKLPSPECPLCRKLFMESQFGTSSECMKTFQNKNENKKV